MTRRRDESGNRRWVLGVQYGIDDLGRVTQQERVVYLRPTKPNPLTVRQQKARRAMRRRSQRINRLRGIQKK